MKLPVLLLILLLGAATCFSQNPATDSTPQNRYFSIQLDNSISFSNWSITPAIGYRLNRWQLELGFGVAMANRYDGFSEVGPRGNNFFGSVRWFIPADNPKFDFCFLYTNKNHFYTPQFATTFPKYSMEHLLGYGVQSNSDRRLVLFHDFGFGAAMIRDNDPTNPSPAISWKPSAYMRLGVSYRFL